MTGRAIRRYDMLVRVGRFGAERTNSFPAETVAGQAFAAIRDAVGALQRHAVTQLSGRTRDHIGLKAAAHARLRESLRIIRRTARGIGVDVPAVGDGFHVPKSNGDHALLTAARACVHDARRLEAAFVAHGLPRTFIDDLETSIDAFERAGQKYRGVRQARVGATAGVDAVLAAGQVALRRLDAIVPNVFRGDEAAMAAWRTVRHVVRKGPASTPDADETAEPTYSRNVTIPVSREYSAPTISRPSLCTSRSSSAEPWLR